MTHSRKLDHLKICIEKAIENSDTGLGDIRLVHRALPEIDFDDISLDTRFLGKKLRYPIVIEAITGGTPYSKKINKDLASVAQEFDIGMGVGSQRLAIENPKLADTYKVRDVAPGVLLIANLGAVQLNYGYGLRECKKAVEMIDADALALHLNPLQEIIQPEGNRNFSGLIVKINRVAKKLGKPVIAKCVGTGIDYETAKKLKVDAISVGGLGGTSWSLVESYRNQEGELGKTFAGWGIRTADSIRDASKLKTPIIGSGGIRTGIDATKAIALGSSVVGMALPLLRVWSKKGKAGVVDYLEEFIKELKIAMFLTGSKNIKVLRGKIV